MYEEQALTPNPVTMDRTKYFQFGVKRFDPSNADGRFNDPHRQDYSADGTTGVNPDTTPGGIAIEQKQETVERYGIRARGRYVSLRVENTQGECQINSLVIENEKTQNNLRRAA